MFLYFLITYSKSQNNINSRNRFNNGYNMHKNVRDWCKRVILEILKDVYT